MTSYDIFHDAENVKTFVLAATGIDANSAVGALRQFHKTLAQEGVVIRGGFLVVPTRNAAYLGGEVEEVPQLVITELAPPEPIDFTVAPPVEPQETLV